jgi:hypothetical protein
MSIQFSSSGDLAWTNEQRAQSKQIISLAGVPKLEYTNSMWVQGKEPDLQVQLLDNVLADVVYEVMALRRREVFIDDRNHTIFMLLGGTSTDKH